MAVQQPQLQTQAVNPADQDPFVKFKALVPRLKDSLSKLMEVAAIAFYQNSQSDNCTKPSESVPERFDKCLEEFYAICDQMELFLRLSLECMSFNADSLKHTPKPIYQAQAQQPQPQQESQTFSQYLHTVKTQISSAKDIHDHLLDISKKLSSRNPAMPSEQNPQAQA